MTVFVLQMLNMHFIDFFLFDSNKWRYKLWNNRGKKKTVSGTISTQSVTAVKYSMSVVQCHLVFRYAG